MGDTPVSWKQLPADQLLRFGIEKMLAEEEISKTLEEGDHVKDTPGRFQRALFELVSGCKLDPAEVLKKSFTETKYDELVVVKDIEFVSLCAHHLLPFFGKIHFGYLPHKKLVGLSKIPRMTEILSRRPQIQERLTHQIVDVFQKTVEPYGCIAIVSAKHMCMSIRGVRKDHAITDTIALTERFKQDKSLKHEFMEQINNGRR